MKKYILVLVPDVETYTGWGEFTNLINVDLATAKKEAIADLQTFINEEKIANAPMEKYESRINAATDVKDIPSIVNNIKAEISNYTKFTLGEWKYLLDKNDGKYAIVGDELIFTDKDLYQSDYNFTVDNSITYSRTFGNTNWQAWFVPFDMTITDELLTDYEFAKFAGTYTDANGQFYITIVKMKSGDVLLGNRAFFIKSKSTGEKRFTPETHRVLSSSTSNHLEMYSAEQKIEVIGIYEAKTATADDCDWYAYGGGTYQKPEVGQTLNPMRFYLTITSRSDNYYDMPPAPFAKIDLMLIDDDEPTDINAISKSESTSDRIYYLNGQAVGKDFKGVVIMNGKKYIKR